MKKQMIQTFSVLTVILSLIVISNVAKPASNYSGVLIHEDVTFGELNDDYIGYFAIEEDLSVDLQVITSIEDGEFTFELLDCESNTIVKLDELSLEFENQMVLKPGNWSYRILCNAVNGEYEIVLSYEQQ